MLNKWRYAWTWETEQWVKKLATPIISAALCMLLTGTGLAAPDYTLPSGGTVVHGTNTAITSPTAGSLVITQGAGDAKAIIDWTGFTIGKDAAVTFQQHQNSYIALNRVLGNDPSLINGSLNANGQVFLVNPNGIMFAQGANVNVGGLVASGFNLTNSNFIAGQYTFDAVPGTMSGVVNFGDITSAPNGYIMLLAAVVGNTGSLVSPQGTVGMAAGDTVSLTMNGNSLVDFVVSSSHTWQGVANTGRIQANNGQVILRAGEFGRLLVNSTGIDEAKSIRAKNGVIRLEGNYVEVAGKLNAKGGNIDISGKGTDANVNFSRNNAELTADTVNITSDFAINQTQGDEAAEKWKITIDGNANLNTDGNIFIKDIAVTGRVTIEADQVLMNTRDRFILGATKVNKALGIFNNLGLNPNLELDAAAGERIEAEAVLFSTKGSITQTGIGAIVTHQGGFLGAIKDVLLDMGPNELSGGFNVYGRDVLIGGVNDLEITSLTSKGTAMIASMNKLTLGDVTVAKKLTAGGMQGITFAGDATVGKLEATAYLGTFTVNGNIVATKGAVKLYGDEMVLAGTVKARKIVIHPVFAGTTITLGTGTDGLNLTNADLERLMPDAGGKLVIGDSRSGDVTIDSPLNLGDKAVTLITGKDLFVNEPVQTTGKLIFSGSGGDNVFHIGSGLLDGFTSFTVKGGGGNDSLLVNDSLNLADTNYIISNTSKPKINRLIDGNPEISIKIRNIERIDLLTGQGSDTVVTQFLPGVSQHLTAGAGTDKLRFDGLTAVIPANDSPYTVTGFGQVYFDGFEDVKVINATFLQPVPSAQQEQYRIATNNAPDLTSPSPLPASGKGVNGPLLEGMADAVTLPEEE